MTEQAPAYTIGSLYQLPCADIQTEPKEPGKYVDSDARRGLVDSLRKQGAFQPILFRADKDGIPFVVAGQHRLQAAKEAGLKTIPAILVEGSDSEIALVENLLRQDLTPIEVAEAIDRIMKEHGYTRDQLTGIVGNAEFTVSEILSLNRLPDEIKNECRNDPSTSCKALLAIAREKKPKNMLTAYRKYKELGLSPRETGGPHGKRKPWLERFASQYDSLTTLIADMDLGALDGAARNELISRVEELKRTADSLIARIRTAPGKETKPAEAPARKKLKESRKKPAAKTAAPKKGTKGL